MPSPRSKRSSESIPSENLEVDQEADEEGRVPGRPRVRRGSYPVAADSTPKWAGRKAPMCKSPAAALFETWRLGDPPRTSRTSRSAVAIELRTTTRHRLARMDGSPRESLGRAWCRATPEGAHGRSRREGRKRIDGYFTLDDKSKARAISIIASGRPFRRRPVPIAAGIQGKLPGRPAANASPVLPRYHLRPP